MIISGIKLSKKILSQLKKDVTKLSRKGVLSQVAIITLGKEDVWMTYVKQKLSRAKKLGIKTKLIHLENPDEKKLLTTIKQLNNDNSIHGIIVQRPLPEHIDREKIINAISPQKDIDGFRGDSQFKSPIWLATQYILEHVFTRLHLDKGVTFIKWLRKKRIAVIGKGETGGKPIILQFKAVGVKPLIIDSQTPIGERKKIIKKTDIVICAVGKPHVVRAEEVKKGAILIGIGIHRGSDRALHGDYDESEIQHAASYYTPTPGGIGPLNLAYLFKNLISGSPKTIA